MGMWKRRIIHRACVGKMVMVMEMTGEKKERKTKTEVVG